VIIAALLCSRKATSEWVPCCTANAISIVDVMALAMFNALSTVNCLLPARWNHRREWQQHWLCSTLRNASCTAEALTDNGRYCCPLETRIALQGSLSLELLLARVHG